MIAVIAPAAIFFAVGGDAYSLVAGGAEPVLSAMQIAMKPKPAGAIDRDCLIDIDLHHATWD